MELDFDFDDNSELTQPLAWTLLFVVLIVLSWEIQALLGLFK